MDGLLVSRHEFGNLDPGRREIWVKRVGPIATSERIRVARQIVNVVVSGPGDVDHAGGRLLEIEDILPRSELGDRHGRLSFDQQIRGVNASNVFAKIYLNAGQAAD